MNVPAELALNGSRHSGILALMGKLATHSPLEEALRSHVELVGLTVDQYDWLVENGKLPEDATTELIDGFMVKKDRSAAGENPITVGIHSVVEVAESSLGRDLGSKLRVYASAKIPQYIVVNLIDNVVLVHQRPMGSTYGEVAQLRAGDMLHIAAGQGNAIGIEVASLL